MNNYQVRDHGDLRKYRTEIPNSIDDMDLSVYAFRLYVHLKRVAGDSGKCWQSTETLSKSCKMSRGMVSKAKIELEQNGLIQIDHQKLERGGRDAHHITIVDVWLENFIKYTGREPSSPDEQPSSPDELASSYSEQASSPHEIKKEPIVKNKPNIKNKRSASAAAKPARQPDERINHPALQEYKRIAHLHVPTAWRDQVISTVGENAQLWATIVYDWIGYGWNKQNISGMLDAFRAGGIQRKNGNGAKPAASLGRHELAAQALERIEARKRAENGNQ